MYNGGRIRIRKSQVILFDTGKKKAILLRITKFNCDEFVHAILLVLIFFKFNK